MLNCSVNGPADTLRTWSGGPAADPANDWLLLIISVYFWSGGPAADPANDWLLLIITV